MFQSVFSFLHVVIQSHKFLNWGGGGQLPPQWSLPCIVCYSMQIQTYCLKPWMKCNALYSLRRYLVHHFSYLSTASAFHSSRHYDAVATITPLSKAIILTGWLLATTITSSNSVV